MSSPDPNPCYVIGHRNPDTDAICSAIGYADFLQRTGREDVMPARCGDVNARTAWVLERAGIDAPPLVMDVRPTALDIAQRRVVAARTDETFLNVYSRMMEGSHRSIPVVDQEGRVVGMPSMREILGLLMPDETAQLQERARHVRSSLRHITEAVRGKLVHGFREDEEEEFVITVAGSSWETIRSRMKQFSTERMLLVVGDRPSIHRLGIDEGVRALVLTGGFEIEERDLELAKEKEVSILYCDQDTATVTQLLRCSRRVGSCDFGPFTTVKPSELISTVKSLTRDSVQHLFPVVSERDGKLEGVLSRTDLLHPRRRRLVLVDHNEFSQAVKGADEAEILEVIDHHRLSGNLVTKEPVRFINEPVGSTSTIVARMYRQREMEPSPQVALCLCAGMISDTLFLSSPTTTDVDREILPWLAGLAGIELESFVKDFFGAGSVLQHLPAAEAVDSDRKCYEESGYQISISQIEELGLQHLDGKRAELLEALEAMRVKGGLDFACVMVTDITKNNSVLLACGDPRVVQRIEYPSLGEGTFRLDGVVSRKKQLFPSLSRILARVERVRDEVLAG